MLLPGPWTKLTEYEPLLGSWLTWKLEVERPKGRRNIFPKSFSFPVREHTHTSQSRGVNRSLR